MVYVEIRESTFEEKDIRAICVLSSEIRSLRTHSSRALHYNMSSATYSILSDIHNIHMYMCETNSYDSLHCTFERYAESLSYK